MAKSGTDIVTSAVNAGLISPRTALKELKQQSERTGVWTNITDADIAKASDDIDAGGEMGFAEEMEEEGNETDRPSEGTAPTGTGAGL